jgi:opacity protein-like surface antigen
VGITHHINKRFYLDFAYRYLRVSATEYSMWDEKLKLNAHNTHTFTASFGFKF